MNESADREAADRAHFDATAQSYGRKDLIGSVSVARRHRAIQSFRLVGKASHVLEIGCGAGHAAHYLEDRYQTYTGLDYSEQLIAQAQDLYAAPNRRFIAQNAKDFVPDRQFDAIIMIGVLHHMPDPGMVLRLAVGWLKPDGLIIANEPHSGNPFVRFARSMRARLEAVYSSEQDQYSTQQMIEIYRQAGLGDISVFSQGYFSTPFAEMPMPVQAIARPAARLACAIDKVVEKYVNSANPCSWNLIAIGRKRGQP